MAYKIMLISFLIFSLPTWCMETIDENNSLYQEQKQQWLSIIKEYVTKNIATITQDLKSAKSSYNVNYIKAFQSNKSFQINFDGPLIKLFDTAAEVPVCLDESIHALHTFPDESKFCPLLYAAYGGAVELAQSVLRHNPNVRIKYENNLTITEMLEILIKESHCYFNDRIEILKLLHQYEHKQAEKITKKTKEIDIEAQNGEI